MRGAEPPGHPCESLQSGVAEYSWNVRVEPSANRAGLDPCNVDPGFVNPC